MTQEWVKRFRVYENQRWVNERGKLSTGYQVGISLEFHGMEPADAIHVLKTSGLGTIFKFGYMTYKRVR